MFSQSPESNSSPADCSEMLLEEISGRLTVDSGHCSASSASLADSTDTTNDTRPQQPYIIALHRKMVLLITFISFSSHLAEFLIQKDGHNSILDLG